MKRTALVRRTGLKSRTGLKRKTYLVSLRLGGSTVHLTTRKPLTRAGPIVRHRPKKPYWVDEELRAFVRTLPCVVPCCGRRSEACHVENKRKGHDRFNLYPGCHGHHHEQHAHGIKTFQRKYDLDLDLIAADVTVRYDAWRRKVGPDVAPTAAPRRRALPF